MGSLGYADQLLLAGRHQFQYLWDKEEIAFNGADSTSSQPSAYDLVLSTMCSQDESMRYCIGKQFTAQSIKGATQKGHAVISGTKLLGQAQLVLKNWKKELAFGSEFLLPNGSLRSGIETADYFTHVLKEMYHYLNVTTIITAVVGDNGDEGDNDDELPTTSTGLALLVAGDNEMPEEFFFPGFVAFVHFGPFAHEKAYKSILLQTMDCDAGEKASAGRAASKIKANDERTASRSSGVTLKGLMRDDGNCGVHSGVAEETAERAAKMAMTDDLVSSTIVSTSIMALSQLSQSKRDRIDRMMKQQKRHAVDSPMYIAIQEKIDELDEAIALAEDKLDGLAATSKRKCEDVVDVGFVAISHDVRDVQQLRTSTPGNRSNESSPFSLQRGGSAYPSGVFSPSGEGVFSPVARMPSGGRDLLENVEG